MVYNINDMKEIIIEHQGTDLFPEGGQESFSEDGAVELKWKGKELAVRSVGTRMERGGKERVS